MNKNGELVIHIGPPKTATTSLQFFFQELNLCNFFYGGIVQPRNKNPQSICSLVYRDITTGKDESKEYVTSKIDSFLDKNNFFFLSEECFLLESSEVSWQQKIDRIWDYFKKFDPTLLIAVREPKKAIISYYHELYNNLQKQYKNDFNAFLDSNYCNIYRYDSLQKYLRLSFNNIILLDFEQLVKGDYSFSALVMNTMKINNNVEVLLKKENISTNIKGKYYTKPTTIHSIISPLLDKIPVPFLKKFKGKGLKRKFLSIIPNLEMSSEKLNFDFDKYDYSPFIDEYNKAKESMAIR